MKKLLRCLCTLSMLTMLFSFAAYATSESGTKIFDKKTNIEPNKEWLIKYNMELDPGSIVNSIYVYDKNRNKVNVSIAINQDGKAIVVQAPKEGYKFGETYSLEIKASTGGIKSNTGRALNQNSAMEFTIKNDPNVNSSEVRGNTSGNINNSGKMIQVGDWIYFNGNIYNDDMNGLYKMKLDGSAKTLISNDDPYYINIVGDWIYYNDFNDDVFYKIKTDGSNKSMFIEEDGSGLNIVDRWAYYTSFSDDTFEEVCRVKLDGTSKTSISNTRAFGYDISNGWIYFSSIKEDSLYKVKYDGTELTKLTDKDNPVEVIASGHWIYYTTMSDSGNTILYKVDIDGKNKTKLSDNKVNNINLIGDYIYYIKHNYEEDQIFLSRIKIDGTEEKAIDNSGIYYFYTVGQWIYCQSYEDKNIRIKFDGTEKQAIYMPLEEVKGTTTGNLINDGSMVKSGDWIYYNNPDNYNLYKMKADGSSKTLLSKDNPMDINVIGEWVYYTDSSEFQLYKIKTNGTGRVKLIEEEVMDVLVVNDWIYYLSLSYDNQEYLCKVKLDGSSRTVIHKGRTFGFDVSDGWVYYNPYDDKKGLYKTKTDESEAVTLIADLKPTKISVSDGYIYYYDRSDEARLYKISVDGKEKLKLSNNTVSRPNVIGDYVYYIDFVSDSSKRVLHRVKIDGTGDKAMDDTPIFSITSVGEWIYCRTDGGKIFKIKLDGTGKQFIK